MQDGRIGDLEGRVDRLEPLVMQGSRGIV
jgi:hypothetical protein